MALGPDHSRPGLSHRVLRGPDSQNRSSAGPVMLDSLSGFFCPGPRPSLKTQSSRLTSLRRKKTNLPTRLKLRRLFHGCCVTRCRALPRRVNHYRPTVPRAHVQADKRTQNGASQSSALQRGKNRTGLILTPDTISLLEDSLRKAA